MKLATLKDGSRDGILVVVSRDLRKAVRVATFARTMQAALDELADVGRMRQPGTSRETFAATVASLTPAFEELTKIHLGAALGGSMAAADCRRGRDLERQVRREIVQSVPWPRRLGGWLDPASWLRVH